MDYSVKLNVPCLQVAEVISKELGDVERGNQLTGEILNDSLFTVLQMSDGQ